MRKWSVVLVLCIIHGMCVAKEFTITGDNGVTRGSDPNSLPMREESIIVPVGGSCTLREVQIYYTGTTARLDTLWIGGNVYKRISAGPAPIQYWNYYAFIPPLVVSYNGVPGWKTVNLRSSAVHVDGTEEVVIQHRVQQDGPWFAIDADGIRTRSWVHKIKDSVSSRKLDAARGDFMVRLVVEYDLQDIDGFTLPAPEPQMSDQTTAIGLNDTSGKILNSGVAAVADVDGDGWDDIIAGGFYFHNEKGYLRNVGENFKTVVGGAWGDYNHDGLLDFYSNGDASGHKLFKQLPDHTFVDVFASAGLTQPQPQSVPIWFDSDQDGDLDLYIANSSKYDVQTNTYSFGYDILWRNNGDGTFSDITASSGIKEGEMKNMSNGPMDAESASPCDYNGDGLIDIFFASYINSPPDRLFKNNGNNRFQEVSEETGTIGLPTDSAGLYGRGVGSAWGDYDNDGDMDLVVSNAYAVQGVGSNSSLVYRNDGSVFTEVHQALGLRFVDGGGVFYSDFNCDGLLDLWQGHIVGNSSSTDLPVTPPRLYLGQKNAGEYSLKDVTWESGAVVHGAMGAVRIDFDHDGDEDVISCSFLNGVRLFRNDLERKGNWLEVALNNPATDSKFNTNLYGTRVHVYTPSAHYIRDLCGSTASNRGSQHSNTLHFGLGNESTIDSVVLRSGQTTLRTFKKLPVNAIYKLNLKEPEVLVLATPALIEPANNSYKLPVNQVCRWSMCGGADGYQILISESPDFSSATLRELGNTVSSFSPALVNNHSYFWKVRAFKGSSSDSSNFSIWSSVYNFTVGLPLPSRVSLRVPKDGTLNFEHKPAGILSWNSATYAVKIQPRITYRIQVSSDSLFSSKVIDTSGIVTRNYPAVECLGSTTYWWRVRAENEGGATEWSDVWKFTTQEEQTSVPEEPLNELHMKLIPNPATDRVSLKFFVEASSRISIAVYDAAGEIVQTKPALYYNAGEHIHQIDVSALASGLYRVTLRVDKRDFSIPLAVLH